MFWKSENTTVMTANELAKELNENRVLLIVDVRSEKDFKAGHLPGAVNIPFNELEERRTEFDKTQPTVFY